MILLLTPEQAAEVWPQAAPILDRAFDRCYTACAQDFAADVAEDRAQLWQLPNGFALSRVVDGKQRVFEYVALAGGDIDKWLSDFLAVTHEWARDVGCTVAVVTGRRGWQRKLRGFKLDKVTLKKEL